MSQTLPASDASCVTNYFASPRATYFLSLLRIITGFMYLQHGLQKSLGILGGQKYGNFFAFEYSSLLAWAGIIESIGAILILLGLFTRPVAFIRAGEMAVAYWDRWAPLGFWTSLALGGEV